MVALPQPLLQPEGRLLALSTAMGQPLFNEADVESDWESRIAAAAPGRMFLITGQPGVERLVAQLGRVAVQDCRHPEV